ncbi:OsmC family protein [Uliginosibacterium aquaticum]|uniref:OsmC family protein n=1 Tax=Uliginosibacterium aquaticum TaxID=2731212 RepID=A0ABX2IEI9_9RHOO|nr:OsmC family protein [Uliginosibacterium aquaticum]NSL55084.1 OsmC family protein [Uliginosibacterium aquaticum]
MECTVSWAGEARFVATTGSGHEVRMEGGAGELGGRNQFPRPMELILAGAGGCTAYDVVLFLKREGYEIDAVEVCMDATRADTEPKVFTRVDYFYTVKGRDLDPAVVERVIHLSAEKYSSATAMLEKSAEIRIDFEVLEALTDGG